MRTIQDVKRSTWQGRRAMNVMRLASNVADGETFTIGDVTFEFDSNATYTAGRVPIAVTTLTPTAVAPLIVAAIGTYTQFVAVANTVNEIVVYAKDDFSPTGAIACTETMAGANNAWSQATMVPGAPGGAVMLQMQQRAATAQDVALGRMVFVFPFTPVAAQVETRTAAGVKKTWDGAVTFSGNQVRVDNAGASDWAAGDVIVVLASS